MDFKWHEPPRPLVTKCCRSFNWSNTVAGDYCYECKTVKPKNVEFATDEDLKKVNSSYEHFRIR